jgi:FKBP-type peptidyl-prolyl cis-trans isomerase 2
MASIKKGDFVELDYTGKLTDDGRIFDTTRAADAATGGLDKHATYKPIVICLGEGQVLRGLDEFLEGKELGAYTCALSASQAFGKKDPKLLKLIAAKKFSEQKIQPFVGLEVNIDDHYGIVRSVSGGRVTVDFNHPLSGRDLAYDVELRRIVTQPHEQVAALLEMIGMHHHGVAMEGEGHVVIKLHSALPQPVAESINTMVTKLTAVKTVTYHVEAASHGKH